MTMIRPMRTAYALTAALAAVAISSPAALATPTTTVDELREVALEAKQQLADATLSPHRATSEANYLLALTQWRKALIAEGDAIAQEREAAEAAGTLTEEEAAAFEEALTAIAEERALVRELRAEVDGGEAVVLPTVLGEIGVVREVAIDTVERSEEGDAQVTFGPLTQQVITLQDTETTTSTTSTTSTTETSTSTSSTTSTSTTATTTTATSATATTSMTAEVLQNRTTEATTTASTTSSTTPTTSTTRSSTTSSTTTTEDDDERDDDLADTGTPMLGVLVIAALLIAGGVYLTRRP